MNIANTRATIQRMVQEVLVKNKGMGATGLKPILYSNMYSILANNLLTVDMDKLSFKLKLHSTSVSTHAYAVVANNDYTQDILDIYWYP